METRLTITEFLKKVDFFCKDKSTTEILQELGFDTIYTTATTYSEYIKTLEIILDCFNVSVDCFPNQSFTEEELFNKTQFITLYEEVIGRKLIEKIYQITK